jgi:pyruvate,water dikinase
LLLTGGQTARPGTGAGPAYLVREDHDLDAFPAGGVLVAAKSSPVFACVLGRAAAVVTEIGGVTGHMASLAREFGVPTIVGARGALEAIPHGQEVTVDATMARVYQGRLAEVVGRKEKAAEKPRACPLGLTWYRAARLITPLTLTDPRSPDFKPDKCATYHDLIRFVHEKSFTEMFRLGDSIGRAAGREARRLAERLPFDLWLIDLGGALAEDSGQEFKAVQVASRPAQAFLEGLLDGRIKWDQPRPVSLRGMASVLSSSLFTPVSDGQVRDMGEKAFAIVSPTYLNFNSRVGYHFAALDSVCGPILNDNYVSFRFQGGAATTDRRTLRAELIAEILGSLGFEVRQEADRVQAFLKKLDEAATAQALAALGRLTLFTRQMDMLVHDRRMVGWLVEAFRTGNYNLDRDGLGPPAEPGG